MGNCKPAVSYFFEKKLKTGAVHLYIPYFFGENLFDSPYVIIEVRKGEIWIFIGE